MPKTNFVETVSAEAQARRSILSRARGCASRVVTAVGVAVIASPVFAADAGTDSYGIQQYIDAAKANVTLTIAGIIGIAALGFGVGMIVSHLRK